MRKVIGSVLILLVMSPAVSAKKRDTKPVKAKKPSSAEFKKISAEYNKARTELLSKYRKAEKEEKAKIVKKFSSLAGNYAPRLIALVKKSPKDSTSYTALAWIVSRVRKGEHFDAALDFLQKDHLQNPRIGSLTRSLGYSKSKKALLLLTALLEKGSNADVKLKACVALAGLLKRNGERGGGKKTLAKSEKMFERAISDFKDAKSGSRSVETAERELKDLRGPRAIGKIVPEIKAEDLDGVEFKLSDYRGKVVVLDFWGHW
ncbi:MAG: redoxin domain-containing protein [Planctomycetes bacterium]|nr:redoxin domain-containing protein [Planctomycetota bacterium]